MSIYILQLLIDFGLVVLIFLVQLCIYPAFKYFEEENLVRWHHIYTPNITYVVFPLMMGQIIVSTYSIYTHISLLSSIHIVLVLMTWLSTFAYFVPLHQKINSNKFTIDDLKKLEKRNWYRLVLWLLIFFFSVLNAYFLHKPITL